ncbi:ABC transporter substrate-binding protein [Streptomyces sp. NPDC001941]|uniref:ABC transporter substrate-binding protein n=1 Tax=Streptomyces sp. NPDC001941 TaxID=3154659 RepID=UPI00331974FB
MPPTSPTSGPSRRGVLALGSAAALLPLVPTEAQAAPAASAPAGEPLRIGALFDLSGPARIQGRRQLLGVRFTARHLNRLHGEHIELIEVDTRGDAAHARAAAERLVRNSHLHALVGTSQPEGAAQVAAVGQAARVPVVMPTTGGQPTQSYVFRSAPQKKVTEQRMMEALAAGGHRRVAALSTEVSTTPPEVWERFAQDFRRHGLELVAHREFTPPADNVRRVIEPLLRARPDAIAVFAAPPYNGICVRDARAAGWRGPMICSPAAGHPGFPEIAGPAAVGVQVVAPHVLAARQAPDTLPHAAELRRFADAFEAAHGAVGTYVAYGADAVTMIHQAYYGHRDRQRARLRLEHLTHVGVAGVHTMTKANHAPLTTSALTVVRWQPGGWVPDKTGN